MKKGARTFYPNKPHLQTLCESQLEGFDLFPAPLITVNSFVWNVNRSILLSIAETGKWAERKEEGSV